jgi:hypothetical protein
VEVVTDASLPLYRLPASLAVPAQVYQAE